MEQNFLFIWMMSLSIVEYYFENGNEYRAHDVFDKAAYLVAENLPKAYEIAVHRLKPEYMNAIWRIEGEKNQND